MNKCCSLLETPACKCREAGKDKCFVYDQGTLLTVMNLDPKVMTFEACSWMSEGHVVDLTGRRSGHKIIDMIYKRHPLWKTFT
ncbi:hypothetical protein AV530_006600 [Patagioenas fasciata monilis]|uniref:Uncharacterized protein n=1 Tax=Patagioenas fasciata monilis TaxID=372326 RepID=A0A1V4KH36_PATFA|nr:hypothetical protein AV530_006600 [Patagioenas fasciata monilis]